MSTKNVWIWIVIVIVVIAGAWLLLDHSYQQLPASPDQGSQTASSTVPVIPVTVPASATPTPVTTSQSSVKNFMHNITIQTDKGTIVFETYDADAPNTVKNFITLANKGFYNGLIFHRVIEGFMIQGGDPTGTGMGGPGYKFADELNPATPSFKAGYVRGTVAMANSGPDTNGSQFFIMQKDNSLPNAYTIFGKVISGMDVVDAIAGTPVDGSDKPTTPIKMTSVTVADAK
jgi:cyclophilin family peptidyl-prolyl cis-trans isomerase